MQWKPHHAKRVTSRNQTGGAVVGVGYRAHNTRHNMHHTPAKSVGRLTSPVASGNKAMECEETEQVLQTVLMAYPGQASSLQGSHGADCDILAANDLGIGSGWQQSKQN